MAKIKFTALSIKSLKPGIKSKEYFDKDRGETGALGIRVSPKGKKTWFIMYYTPGQVKRFSLGTYPSMTLKAARDEATEKMGALNKGEALTEKKVETKKKEEGEGPTFNDLWEYYLTAGKIGRRIKAYTNKAESTQKEDIRKYNKHLLTPLGSKKIQDITEEDIKGVLNSLKGKIHSINRLYALLNVLFRHARKEKWISHSPMPEDYTEAEQFRENILENYEIKAIWPELKGQIGVIYKLILLTGQRPGQVMGMRWEEVNPDDSLWTLPRERTKNKKGNHVVPLSEQAAKLVESQRTDSDYVFPRQGSHIKYISNYRYQIQKRTGIKGWSAHDLRRTAGTIMNDLVSNEALIERVLGHSVEKIRSTYNRHGYLREKRAALDKLGREIDRIIGIKHESTVIQLRQA
jgi:integrase